jgi:hypothetical protein
VAFWSPGTGCHGGLEDALYHLASVVGELHGTLNKCRLIYWRPETEAKFVAQLWLGMEQPFLLVPIAKSSVRFGIVSSRPLCLVAILAASSAGACVFLQSSFYGMAFAGQSQSRLPLAAVSAGARVGLALSPSGS